MNIQGQLGDNTRTPRRSNATLVGGALRGRRVVRIAAGLAHSVALDDQGTLYGWGANARGQLGSDAIDDALEPRVVGGVDWHAHGGIVDLCAGGVHTVLVTRDGGAYAMGGASWGATALGHMNDVRAPMRIQVAHEGASTPRVVNASCGGDHTLLLLSNGTLLAAVCNYFFSR